MRRREISMKKITKLLYVIIIILALSLVLTSCTRFFTVDDDERDEDEEVAELSVSTVYKMAKESGYTGTLEEFIAEFKGEDGADGVGISDISLNAENHLIIALTNGETVDCGEVGFNIPDSSITIGENGNWYINGEDTGKSALGNDGADGATWLTGDLPPTAELGKIGDLYFNTDSCDVYQKLDTGWTVIANIKGESGDVTVNEGDDYNITVNGSSTEKYAAAKALLSAVRVEAVHLGRSYSGIYNYYSQGSGVIFRLDKAAGDAYIITNFHVVYDAESITENKIADEINLFLYGMEYADFKMTATYIGGSMMNDIAVLKIENSDILRSSAAVQAEIADSSAVRVMDSAIAIGNPAASGISVTCGVVSVESQYITMLAPDELTEMELRVMRIDTPVNSGNSGGGLFNSEGKLIGIVNAKEKDTSLENMGYAIPSNVAVYVAENIIRNCEGTSNEQPIKCRLGIMIQASSIKVEYDPEKGTVERKEDCIVLSIDNGSVAEGRLMANDLIKSFEIDGVTYPISFSYDGGEALFNADLDSSLFINVERDGEPLRIEIPLGQDNFVSVQ